MARGANAGVLMLGHFSSRYRNLDGLLEEARNVFPDSILAEERETYALTAQGIVKK
jgi:ribonuclease Z